MFELPSIDANATDAQVFKSSPSRALGIVATPFLLALWTLADPRIHISLASPRWELFILLSLASVIVAYGFWSLVRPVTLIANDSGFALTGGFRSGGELQPWRDVDRFLVTSASRKERVACALRPGAERYFPANSDNSRAIFSGFYPSDPEQVADQLNALRRRAIGDSAPSSEASPIETFVGGRQPGRSVAPEIVRSSRWIYAAIFAVILIPGALVILAQVKTGLLNQTPHSIQLLLVLLLLPIMFGALWFAVRPPFMALDEKGFTLMGGFVRSPNKVLWTDVHHFLVYNPPKNFFPKIAYNAGCGGLAESGLGHGPRKEVIYLFFFVTDADETVNHLNDYRDRATGTPNDCPS
jgi:hypothetical protein